MTDIVKELRSLCIDAGHLNALTLKAADEIERLQVLLAMALPYVDGRPSLRAAINEAISGKVKDGSG